MVERIGTECDVDIPAMFHQRWLELFREIMYHLLEDGAVDVAEKDFARNYISIFKLDKSDVDEAIQRSGRDIFVEKLIRMVGPDGLSDNQYAELGQFAKQIGLKDMQSAYNETVGAILELHIQDILLDSLLTPDEIKNFTDLCNRLRVDPAINPNVEQKLLAAQERWELLSKPLTPIKILDLRLGKEEISYLDEPAEWHETRKIRIGRDSFDRYQLIHSGRVILTNTRLLLIANDTGSNKTLKWSRLLAAEYSYGNDIELVKERGKSPIIKFFDQNGSLSNGPVIVKRLFDENE